MTKPLTSAELQKIITRWEDGGGMTAAVQAFAQAVPVAERTVWYWLGGRKIHPAMAQWIRQIATEKAAAQRAEHEYGTTQGKPVRPFLKTACDKLAKQMGEKIKADYREMLQQQAAKTILRETERLVALRLCQRCGRGKNSQFHLRDAGAVFNHRPDRQ